MKREAIRPTTVPTPSLHYSPAVRAGKFVFVSGQVATDFRNGLAPEARVKPGHPYHGEDPIKLQARYNFKNIAAILEAAGTSLENLVWVNQFYPRRESVDPYHEVRREFLGSQIPPSTSVAMCELMVPGAGVATDALVALVPEGDFRKENFRPKELLQAPGGFAASVRTGDYVWVAGQMAMDLEHGIVAKKSPYIWDGWPIKLEADYVLRHLAIALEVAGSDLEHIVKAQCYVQYVSDLPRLEETWRQFFPGNPPARSVIPVLMFGVPEGHIEVNAIALTRNGKAKKELVYAAGVSNPPAPEPHAVRAGELVFLSGLQATDGHGLIPDVRVLPEMPYFGSQIQNEMRVILQKADAICHAAGTTLSRVVRIQAFFIDLHDLYPASQVLAEFFPQDPPAFHAVRVPESLPIPGGLVLLDIVAAMP